MKEIKLTRGKVAIVDDEDFDYLNQWKWYCRTNRNINYAVRAIYIDKKQFIIQMHRLIIGLKDKKLVCDHINHDGLDNRKVNLRISKVVENARNKRSAKNSSSKYLGVSWHKLSKKWRAKIYVNNKHLWLGVYSSEKDAASAYNEAAKIYYKEYANLNLL